MPLLFSYGTLQEQPVQMATFGRILQGEPGELVGFERTLLRIDDEDFVAASGRQYHAIIRFTGDPGSRVSGTAYEVSEQELARADAYEPAGYARVSAAMASGEQAWVYVDASHSAK